jgi:RecA-family ATPase
MRDEILSQELLVANTFINQLKEIGKPEVQSNGLFVNRTANEWMAESMKRPIPKRLFGSLWYENELAILFADTNLGKSILAVQMAESISNGKSIRGFTSDSKKEKVLYFDFELSDKQFENRYSQDYQNHFVFSVFFIRVEFNSDVEIPNGVSFEDFLFERMENLIVETEAKIIIIDNLTFLKDEVEKARNALPLMKNFKALKKKYGLSVLLLAHTPKRDLSKAITRNDLSGSKMLMNFCDSAFTIGESNKDKSLRYLKQIKARQTEIVYDSENVAVCQIQKKLNFLEFNFLDFGAERDHLRDYDDKERDGNIAEALKLHKEGLSNVEIGKQFGVTEGAIRKWLKKAENSID